MVDQTPTPPADSNAPRQPTPPVPQEQAPTTSTRAFAEPTTLAPAHHGDHRVLRTGLHALKEFAVRAYALVLVVVLVWAGYMAFMSLVHTVFVPMPVPERFLQWQGQVDAAALRAENVPGVTGPAARAPIGHYHKVERWFQPDALNGCTTSGCHEPLPHTKKAHVPAFANFHATFLSCQMCHVEPEAGAKVIWASTSDARATEVPAVLRLMRYLEAEEDPTQSRPAEAHQTMVTLLRETLDVAGEDASLSALLLQIETAEPGSPVWRRAVDRLLHELPLHARGEYGAKLARETADGQYLQTSRNLAEIGRKYVSASTDPGQRVTLRNEAHGRMLKEPVGCITCHGEGGGGLDYASLGYSARRARFLGRLQLASLMQQIRQGEQFHLPKLLEGGNGR